MQKMRGLVLLLAVFVIMPGVFAGLSLVPVKDRINNNEKAIFELKIENTGGSSNVYNIYSETSAILWSVSTKPLGEQKVLLGPGESKTTQIIVEPIEMFNPGVYIVNLNVDSENEKLVQPLKIYIGPKSPMDYLPSLRVSVDMDEKLDPTKVQSAKLFVENLNPLNLSGLVIKAVSEIPELNLEQAVDILPGPGSKKTIEFTFQIPETQQPKSYTIFFQFELNKEIVKVVDKRVEVITLIPEFEQEINEKKGFLRNELQITYTNKGNVRNMQTKTLRLGVFERLFTGSSPEAYTIKKDAGRVLAWDMELSPNESGEVRVVTSYYIPLILLIIALTGAVVYIIYKSPLKMTKQASNVTVEDGTVSGLKVMVGAKNIGTKVLKDVEITDYIPGIADVEKNIEMGTLKPIQVMRSKSGHTVIKWKLSELEPKEERLITYKIKSKLNIVGTFELARAKASFTTSRGKRKVSYSNKYSVSTEE